MDNLLNSVRQIITDHENQILKNGENFNIYSLLGLEKRENQTHSQIIADLLSPTGSHGQGNQFLKIFFETLGIQSDLENSYIKVSREYFIGRKNNNDSEGGRIDILIEVGNKKWVIENKIDAIEQPKQLERYYSAFPNAQIFFLTLDGKNSVEHYNLEIKKIDYRPISYSEDIRIWLGNSIKQIEDKEYLKNSIQQYLNLIDNLTYNGYTKIMDNKIIEIVSQSLLEGLKIKDAYQHAFNSVENDFFRKVLHSFENEYQIDNSIITKPEWKKENIGIGFERENFNLFYGICILDKNIAVNTEILSKLAISCDSQNKPTLDWPLWYWYFFGDEESYIADILEDDKKILELQLTIKDLAQIIDNIMI